MMTPAVKLKNNAGHTDRTFWGIYLVLLCICGIIFTRIGVADSGQGLVSLFVTVVGTMGVFAWFIANEKDRTAAFILCCGYFVRVAYRCAVESGLVESVSADAGHFWEASSNLYHGIPNSIVLTKYPYLLRWFYEVFGSNRYVAEYVNILFWGLSSVILVKLGRHAGLSGKRKYILYGIWVVLPASILIGTDLLRENIMVFFDMWSFYMFLGWMKNGSKFRCAMAFLLAAPAAYLHTASIALWAAYIVTAAFWDGRKRKFRFMQRTMLLLSAGILGAGLILFSPLNGIFGAYLGGDLSIYGITHRPYEVGGSDYLQWMDCKNILQFILYTLLRMFYFLFSPMPWEARGLVDLFSFALDGLLVLVLLAYMGKQMKFRERIPYLVAAMVCILAFAGIFAWGVRNAGTAIRHRMLVWAVLIMGSCVAMGGTSGWKGTDNEKKDSTACAEKQ